MSDHDEMDVDVPPLVSSDEPKGKRSAANLPVEAEDNLPWFVEPSHSFPCLPPPPH